MILKYKEYFKIINFKTYLNYAFFTSYTQSFTISYFQVFKMFHGNQLSGVKVDMPRRHLMAIYSKLSHIVTQFQSNLLRSFGDLITHIFCTNKYSHFYVYRQKLFFYKEYHILIKNMVSINLLLQVLQVPILS